MNKPQITAVEREITRLKKKLNKITTKIENASSYGTELVKAHNIFTKKFNSTTDVKERLNLISSYEEDKKRFMGHSKYDICDLMDQQVKIELDIHQLECDLYLYKIK